MQHEGVVLWAAWLVGCVMKPNVFVLECEISDFSRHGDIVRRNCGGDLYGVPNTG